MRKSISLFSKSDMVAGAVASEKILLKVQEKIVEEKKEVDSQKI